MDKTKELMEHRNRHALEHITRIAGDIPDGCGVLNIRYDAWFEYENDLSMLVALYGKKGAFKENGFNIIDNEGQDGEFSEMLVAISETDEKPSLLKLPKSIVVRSYLNESYVSLVGKSGNEYSDIGFPFVSTIENLNAATHISFTLLGLEPNVLRTFMFPISVHMTEEERFASIHFKDMFYYNQQSAVISEQVPRKLEEQARNLSVSTPIILDGKAQVNSWSWCENNEIKEHLEENLFPGINETWMVTPFQELAALVYEDGSVNPYVPLFGLDFSYLDDQESIENNTIRVVGTGNPVLLMP